MVALIVAFRIALPLVTIDPTWEFHRDEFLYFAMGDHFHLFGMQFPPLIAALARISKAIFGDDVLAAWCLLAVAGAVLAAAERNPRWWLLIPPSLISFVRSFPSVALPARVFAASVRFAQVAG